MKYYLKIKLIIILTLLVESSTLYAEKILDFAREFQDDAYLAFVIEPSESTKIFHKYSKDFNHEFTDILTNINRYDKALIRDIILISAININEDLLEQIKRVYSDDPLFYEQRTRFYYFRIGIDREINLKYIIGEFEGLLKAPSDSDLIVFLPFLNDIELSLHYLSKLSSKADGAIGELVWWSANYLYFMYQGNKVAVAKIKDSTVYFQFIKNK